MLCRRRCLFDLNTFLKTYILHGITHNIHLPKHVLLENFRSARLLPPSPLRTKQRKHKRRTYIEFLKSHKFCIVSLLTKFSFHLILCLRRRRHLLVSCYAFLVINLDFQKFFISLRIRLKKKDRPTSHIAEIKSLILCERNH